jgi:hypothetical protein
MNDHEPMDQLEEFKAEHRRLDEQIRTLIAEGTSDQLELARLKRRKLRLKDQIQILADAAVPDIIA